MASTIVLPNSPVDIEFGFEQAREFILEPAFGKPSITEFHTVDQDIVAKKQIAYLGRLGLTGLLDSGCADPVSQSTSVGSEKFWDPKTIKMEQTECFTDIEQSLFIWAAAKGINKKDLTQNALYTAYNTDIMTDASREGLFRRAWFADTTIVAGDLTGGAPQVPYFTPYDGFWPQIFASVTAGGPEAARQSYVIAENSEATKADQLNLAADTGYNAFKGLVNGADSRLLSQPGQVIIATRTLFDNFADYLESQGVDLSYERIEGGFDRIQYRGRDIYSFDLWDRVIQTYFDNGTTYDTPHRALLTTRDNLRVGLDSATSPTQLQFFYDPVKEENISRIRTTEDVKLVFDYFISAAY